MTTPSIVRLATPADHSECWRLLLQSHKENGIFTLDPIKVEFLLNRALHSDKIPPWDQGPRAYIGVIGPPAHIEAFVFLTIGSIWYSSELYLEELLVFVDPECRKSSHAKTLIGWMQKTSDTLGMPLITGIVSKERTQAKIRLYDRYIPRVGAIYMYPNTGYDILKRNGMDHDYDYAKPVVKH